ncbi:MAG: hypothetical protein K5989_01285, partial [Lachnospiraceae bacterium]|nr:hypothetical protein [Lachnospiraceae bacterium]
MVNFRNKLLDYGKKNISLDDLVDILGIKEGDAGTRFACIQELMDGGLLEPVKSSGVNGNIRYPLYKRYRISIKEEENKELIKELGQLHPILLKSGFLSAHPRDYIRHKDVIEKLNGYLFSGKAGEPISRKERSFEIFGREKLLDDSGVKALLRSLQIKESDLAFYDTPEYCFHDYIPERKEELNLLICENKDIWFNIRRCMFEDHYRSLFGVPLDGVVFG